MFVHTAFMTCASHDICRCPASIAALACLHVLFLVFFGLTMCPGHVSEPFNVGQQAILNRVAGTFTEYFAVQSQCTFEIRRQC